MDLSLTISLIAVILNIFTFVVMVMKIFVSFSSRLTKVETQAELFWGAAGKAIAEMIKQPTHLTKDKLLDQLIHCEDKMSNDELLQLKGILMVEMPELLKIHPVKDGRPLAYSLALARINILLDQRGCACEVDAHKVTARQGLLKRIFG